MYIKIYTNSQLELLRRMNRMQKEHSIPEEVLKEVGRVLRAKRLGKHGFTAIIREKVGDDMQDILDILDMSPYKLMSDGEEIKQVTGGEKDMEEAWYRDIFRVKGTKDNILVFYRLKE